MDSQNERRRYEDEAIANLTRMVSEQGAKMDAVRESMHKMEIHMADLMAKTTGRFDKLEYRVEQLEGNQKTVFNYIAGIIMAVVTAVCVWVVQQWGAHVPLQK